MKADLAYLQHIREAIEKIESYLVGVSREDFERESLRVDAVVRELEIIGEAAGKLGDLFRQQHPDFPAAQASGMRNRLIHEYFAVDLDVVWRTVHEDLPRLRSSVTRALENL